jgi:hypothetical protein
MNIISNTALIVLPEVKPIPYSAPSAPPADRSAKPPVLMLPAPKIAGLLGDSKSPLQKFNDLRFRSKVEMDQELRDFLFSRVDEFRALYLQTQRGA